MKKLFWISMMATGTAFAVPQVSKVSFTQDAASGKVTVGYSLDAPAVVTFAVETQAEDGTWSKVGGEATSCCAGDVNRLVTPVQDASNAFTWYPRKSWPVRLADGKVRISVNAWALDNPPPYMVVDLVLSNKVEYYESAEAIPGGVGADRYKTQAIVMRKIPAAGATFRMGSSATERGYSTYGKPTTETPHDVTFTKDFYLGIYEVTFDQHRNVGAPRYYAGCLDSANPATWKRPVTSVSRYGNTNGEGFLPRMRGMTYLWPTDLHKVTDGSVIDLFRDRTGVAFDLPTEFEWEFACRAGSDGIFYDSSNYPTNIAWCGCWTDSDDIRAKPDASQEVGLLEPNAWGLYDMLGNVSEICLNAWNSGAALSSEPETDPTGVGGTQLVYRGGNFTNNGATAARCAARGGIPTGWDSGNQHAGYGYRLWAPAVAAQ